MRSNGETTATAVLYLQRDLTELGAEVKRIDREHVETRLDLARLGAKVSLYAALGAVLGGGAISFLIRFIAP